ncbi:hypothetical protein ASD15_26860 [Massilia sp. Root351]|uniref:YncE family protein n=1 Tax=Massilia sp. Root351 TaxID=1736522 RepID=UPI00070B945E|nr:hypothetical protein [Massilia sp. Root351]KQV88702.1 hypothetical protein ASD15_26860 [Massilia sp. Root351]
MDVLVTTSQSLLLIDTDTGHAHRIDSGRGLYYGLACHGDRIYVAARRRLVSSEVPSADERGEILMFDRGLRYCGSLQAPFPLRDLHEIAWHGGKLWATASHDDMIAIYDGANWEQWYPLATEGQGDVHHFNSFMFEDGLVWILAHNRGASDLLAFSLDTRELVQRHVLGNCSHNIWREQGQLYTCSSAESRVMGQDGFTLETGGFPRGVAFDADSRCIGISTLSERKARDFNAGALLLTDRQWQRRHELALDDEGLVLDVMRLPPGFALAQPGPLQRGWQALARAFGAPSAPAPEALRFPRR